MSEWENVKSDITSSSRKTSHRIEFHPATKCSTSFKLSTRNNNQNKDIILQTKSSTKDLVGGPLPGLFSPSLLVSYMRWRKAARPGPGLFNHGNTCFLNSILQCLLHTPVLSQILLDENLSTTILSKVTNQKTVVRYFHRLVKDFWVGAPGKAVSPRIITQNIRQIGKQFRPMRQEDAHEFLRQLLDTIHEEILKAHNLKVSDGKICETTFISRIFGGYLRNELKCPKCPYASRTYNHFQDLSLDLTGNKIKSVQDALAAFVRPEKLGSGNEWKCDGCKKKVEATKQMTIFRAPAVLVIHLKRFTYGNMTGKISRNIIFEESLDVQTTDEDVSTPNKTAKYNLSGVVVHHGSSVHSGHYIAYVKSASEQWHLMDDSVVTVTTLRNVLAQQAYILFYTRQDPSPPPLLVPPTGKEPVSPALSSACTDPGTEAQVSKLNGHASSTSSSHIPAAKTSVAASVSQTKPPTALPPAVSGNALASADSTAAVAPTQTSPALNRSSNGPEQKEDGRERRLSFDVTKVDAIVRKLDRKLSVCSDDAPPAPFPAVKHPTPHSLQGSSEPVTGTDPEIRLVASGDLKMRLKRLHTGPFPLFRFRSRRDMLFAYASHRSKRTPLRKLTAVSTIGESKLEKSPPEPSAIETKDEGYPQSDSRETGGLNGVPDLSMPNEASTACSASSFLRNAGKRVRELHEGVWDGMTLDETLEREVKRSVQQQLAKEQSILKARKASYWDTLLDQGKVKKVKPTVVPLDEGEEGDNRSNPFQTVSDARNMDPRSSFTADSGDFGSRSSMNGSRGNSDRGRGGRDRGRGGRSGRSGGDRFGRIERR